MELIDICTKAAEASTTFEQTKTELKKQYLIKHYMMFNELAALVNGNQGTFATGYPCYALGQNFEGQLPIIDEQIRYNNELINDVTNSSTTIWNCADCLAQFHHTMPDLKQVCKPCPNMDNTLKPRKILNRLPDMDMWMICDDSQIRIAQEQLIALFNQYGLYTSDIDPVGTIHQIIEISNELQNGNLPSKMLPIDAHLIEYSKLASLIEQVPYTLKNAIQKNQIPYLPIHPSSYRKTWQYDDAAYNFIHDYLSSLTEFNFDDELNKLLMETRKFVANEYSFEQLYYFLISSGPESVLRRHRTRELKTCFQERINSWKR